MIPSRKTETTANRCQIQPNPTFEDGAEMKEWLKVNIPGAVIIKIWKVQRLACLVDCPMPKGK